MKRLLLAIAILLLPAQVLASSCNVTEFALVAPGGVQVAKLPAVADQTPITTSGSSALSATLNGDTKMIRVFCDTQSAMAYDGTATPSATTNNMPIAAGIPEYFNVQGGKVAFILRP